MELKCNKCGRIWDYKGKSKHYATCYDCRNLVNIEKNAIKGHIKGEME